MPPLPLKIFAACFFFLWYSFSLDARPEKYFAIEIVDEETRRGVPLVELRTVHGVTYVTDSAGRVAFHEPGLMNERIHFEVRAHGYEIAADGFGFRGFVAHAIPGESVTIAMKRTNIAERLYRLTGGGIYRDSALLGQQIPMEKPLLNGLVLGQDSTMAVEYQDRVFWFWGDTLRPSYPLGNYHMAGATSLPGASLHPEKSIDYDYFVDETGFARKMAPIPGEGPTWLGGLTVVNDGEKERLVGGYAKIRNSLETYARGLVLYDDEQELFLQARIMAKEDPLYPIGHSLKVGEGEEAFVHFTNPLPLVRVRAKLNAYMEPAGYEAFTPLVPGSRLGEHRVERDKDGKIIYGWKKETPEAGQGEQEELIKAGVLRPEERLFALRDWRTGKEVKLHAGGVNWNPFRKRWILIASEIFGDSVLGEVWFAEADSPLGPWVYGQKIVSHDDYTFYNPRHHPFLDRNGGRLIYFEGTYTQLFSGAPIRTPRYDYNQILYRLDLATPELVLPIAIYREGIGGARCFVSAHRGATGEQPPDFWALERQRDDAVTVLCRKTDAGECHLETGATTGENVLFYALPPEASELPSGAFPLKNADGVVICHVWEHPMPQGPALPIRMNP